MFIHYFFSLRLPFLSNHSPIFQSPFSRLTVYYICLQDYFLHRRPSLGLNPAHSASSKNLTPFPQEAAHFSGAALWHNDLTLTFVTPLWDSAPIHSPSGKESNPSLLLHSHSVS